MKRPLGGYCEDCYSGILSFLQLIWNLVSSVDEMYGYPIFKWDAETWPHNRVTGQQHFGEVHWAGCMTVMGTVLGIFMKGRVRIRKSKSGEKWNDQLVNDAYGVLLYRCCTSKVCSCKCQILHHGCALKRERWASWAFLPKLMHFKDFEWIFYYKRTQALAILFQHVNKYGDWSC